ncbi:MAG: glucokinase [Planctomycetota bacterium]
MSAQGRLALAGDVGGTNVRLALVETGDGPARVVARSRRAVSDHSGLEEPVTAFLAEQERRPSVACFGVAATVSGRRAAGVNLPWGLDADALEAALGLPVRLINDFHAAARGVEQLSSAGWFAVGGGDVEPEAPIAVLGAGTGLGQALLIPRGDGGRVVVPGEGGHRDFAPRDPLQDQLLAWLRGRHGRVSTERVLSGPGLAATYAFLVAQGRPACPEVEAAPEAERPPAVLRSGEHETCAAALDLFTDVYGAEASNLALTVLARSGVYVAGGIAPDLLGDPGRAARFRRAFEDKGRFAGMLAGYAVRVVTDGDLGLLGAAAEA